MSYLVLGHSNVNDSQIEQFENGKQYFAFEEIDKRRMSTTLKSSHQSSTGIQYD
jgi:hypothetical protein